MHSLIHERTLGRTGQLVSAVGLGTWSFGGPKMAQEVPVGWTGGTEQAGVEALVEAHRRGINHWDTADVYGDGRAEALIAKAWSAVPRDAVFLASKVGWDKGQYSYFYNQKHMRHQIERSLRLLKTDSIDLYYLHHCDFGPQDEHFDDAMEMIHRFKDEGKIRFIGLSDWSCERIMKFVERADPDVVQPYRNVLDDDYENSGLKTWIEANKAGVAFFSPLRHGLLLGKYSEPQTFADGDFRSNVPGFQDQQLLERLRTLRAQLEERFAAHPHAVLYALVGALLTNCKNACVLLGQRNPQQVDSASQVGAALSAEDAAWMFERYAELK